jgi:hypothetical protein
MLVLRRIFLLVERRICHEEAVFGRTDRSGVEAGGAWSSGCGADPSGGISEMTFYRWKKQYSGLESDQVRELKQVVEENSRLPGNAEAGRVIPGFLQENRPVA